MKILSKLKTKYILRGMAYLLGIIFLTSGISKFFRLSSFINLIKAYKIFPNDLITELVILLIIIEVVIGFILFISRLQAVAAGFATILFTCFMLLAIYAKYNGIKIDCGCFSFLHVQVASITHFLQNAFFLFISISILFLTIDKKNLKD